MWAWLTVVVLLAVGGIAAAVSSSDNKDVREAGSNDTTERTDETDPETTPPTDTVARTTGQTEAPPPTDSVSTVATTEPSATTEETAAPTTELTSPTSEVAGSPPGVTGERTSPVPAGQVADIGGGWRLQVLNIDLDGAPEVAALNDFNDPPPPGSTFTLITVALGYFGLDDPKSPFEATISAVGVKNVELSSDCGVIPASLDSFGELFAGGVTVGNLCFVTTPEDAPKLQLYAQGGFFSENQVFLDATTAPVGAVQMAALTGPQPGAKSTPGRLAPTPVGTADDLGEGWQVVVTGAARDITDAVQADNTFNDPPPDGYRFVGVDVTYTYSGAGSASVLSVTTNGVSDANRGVTQGCGVFTGELDTFVDLFAGGSASGTICFAVPADGIPSLALYSTATFGGAVAILATS